MQPKVVEQTDYDVINLLCPFELDRGKEDKKFTIDQAIYQLNNNEAKVCRNASMNIANELGK